LITAAQKEAQRNRGTLFVEDGELVSTDAYPGEQFVMRIRAPKCAAAATAGSFVHVACDETLPMRRPLSIMRAGDDWIEVLYKIVGEGLHLLAEKRPGDTINVLGPIGHGFEFSADRPNCLLIGGGVGIPPMVFLAEVLRDTDAQPLAILGSEIPFPFELRKSGIETSWAPADITSTMPLLESWAVPTRLTSLSDFEGCYRGYVTDLAELWLQSLDEDEKARVEIFTCGPTPMLKAVAALAQKYGVPCQVSLEEFMACAVGGCAGCTVKVTTPEGPAMKRVCVDGPVFDAKSVVWA
jgi:dihydroorotate dehydrogenase electron transfer subunit